MAVPSITSITPSSGYQDETTLVSIVGTNLASATSVTIGSNGCQIVSNTATLITCYIPKYQAVGAGTVTVTTAGGTDTETFTVVTQPFMSVDPASKFGSYKDATGKPTQVQLTSTGAVPVDTELTFSGSVMVEDVVIRGSSDGGTTTQVMHTDTSGDVQSDILSIVPGTGATNLGKAEDAAHTSGDTGVMLLSVRQNTAAALSGTDADYQPLITDTNGRLHTQDAKTTDIETNTDYGTVVGTGTEATALRVTIASDSTGVLSVDDNSASLSIDIGGQAPQLDDTDKIATSIYGKSTAAGDTAVLVDASGHLQVDVLSGVSVNLSGDDTDLDTGAGTDDHEVIAIGLPGVGGHVVGGTTTNPIQIADAGGTLTVDQATAANLNCTEASAATIAGDTTSLDSKVPAMGTAVMTGSTPVTIATNDTMITALDAAVDIVAGDTTSLDSKVPAMGTAVMTGSTPVTIATNDTMITALDAAIDAINGKLVSGTDIGDVTINNTNGASAVNIQDGGNSITIDGTVDTELTTADLDTGVGEDLRAVVGLVGSASGGGAIIPGSATDGLLVNLGTNNDVTVSATDLDIRDLTATDVVTANLSVTDNAVLDAIDGNTDYGAVIGGGVEATALRVTIANDSTGVLTVDDGGSTLSIDDGASSITVDGTFWQATQPVSGTFWQATQPVSEASPASRAVTNAGTFAVQAAPNRTVAVTSATGALAINTTTAIAAKFRLSSVTLHAGAAMANENLTITIDALDGVAYDAVLYSVNTSGVTDIAYIPDNDLVFEAGDEIVVACTNTNAVTYGLRIVTEAI